MQFSLMGFKQNMEFRVFAFECVAADKTVTEYRVRANLALIRQYGIQVQELPLLCRGLLERDAQTNQSRTMTFTEEEMRSHARTRAAVRELAVQKKKSTHKPPSNQVGNTWRVPPRPIDRVSTDRATVQAESTERTAHQPLLAAGNEA
jgi:hypothetical protein